MGECSSYHLLPLLIISPSKLLENKGERGTEEDRMTEDRNKERAIVLYSKAAISEAPIELKSFTQNVSPVVFVLA